MFIAIGDHVIQLASIHHAARRADGSVRVALTRSALTADDFDDIEGERDVVVLKGVEAGKLWRFLAGNRSTAPPQVTAL